MQNDDSKNKPNPDSGNHGKNFDIGNLPKQILKALNPWYDFKFALQTGVKPIISRIKTLSVNRKETSNEKLNFEQAVKASGKTIPQLTSEYKAKVIFWTFSMFGCMIPPVLIILAISLAEDLPTITLLRACTWAFIFMSLSVFSYVHLLAASFRSWQVRSQKVSIKEGGTFQDFSKEVRPIYDLLTMNYQNSIFGDKQ